MNDRRRELLDAAVEVLAAGGARALTHRAVDQAAKLPGGSASNVFRTRSALVDGVLQHLIEQELESLPPVGSGAPGVVDEEFLVKLSGEAIVQAIGPGRELTLARRALFLEASHDSDASDRLERASRFWWTALGELLARAGAPDPAHRARLLLAYVDGVISDQLARPDAPLDAAAAIRPAIRGILSG